MTVQDLNQSLADSFGLKRVDGALVSSVAPDSAAAAAGLKSGDVITEVNGEPVVRSGELSSLIGMAAPGERVKLKVWRDRAERTIEAKLGSASSEGKTVADASAGAERGSLGLTLRPLTRDEKREAKVDSGLVVEDVDGAAERAGIQRRRRAARHQRQAGGVDRAGQERHGRKAQERRAAGPARGREDLRPRQGGLTRDRPSARPARCSQRAGRFSARLPTRELWRARNTRELISASRQRIAGRPRPAP